LNELVELCNEAYEKVKIYKAKTKAFYDKVIFRKSFKPNQKVWLFNFGVVRISDPQDGQVLMVNGQYLKPVVTHDIAPDLISINLADPVYYD